jgi:hypothetical protein
VPEVTIALPTFYPAQVEAFRVFQKNPRTSIRCGRRWGKTDFAKTIACDAIAKGRIVGWFVPEHKYQSEAYTEIYECLFPIKRGASKVEGVIRTITGGRIDFWTLENERAGRSRKYHLVVIDEAAFGKANVKDIWERAIEPTLLDYGGKALILSNANGNAQDNFFYQISTEERFRFREYHSTTFANPHLPREFLDQLEANTHPLVFRQEYLAEFVDFSGAAFFAIDWLLDAGRAVPYPRHCDGVFVVIDTAVKTGSANDGTAALYVARSMHTGIPLVILDWDLVQIEGASLEEWMPSVFRRAEELAIACKARQGSLGAFIEDAQSGSILIQQCRNKGLPVTALPSGLTAAGKDRRAIDVSGYVYRQMVKISDYAYDKTLNFKGSTRNHLITQITGYRVGDKNAATRADDLLDCFTYGLGITFGNPEGF